MNKIQGLRLTNKRASIRRHINNGFHREFPRCFVQIFQRIAARPSMFWIEPLAAMMISRVSSFQIPKRTRSFSKVLIDHNMLARQSTAGINIGGVRLKTFVVAEYLRRGSGRHWCQPTSELRAPVFINFCPQVTSQSHRFEGFTPHISNWNSPLLRGLPLNVS